MIISPISSAAVTNALIPASHHHQHAAFLPGLQQNVGLLPNTAANTGTSLTAGNPYLTANSIAGGGGTASHFEGFPIYLLANNTAFPHLAATKMLEPPASITSSPSGNQRVNTSAHFRIFVGDISPEIDHEKLREAFAQFGEISETKVIRDPHTLKSKGYGFVTYVNREDAARAIGEMSGQRLGQRSIRTNWATHKLRKQSSSATGSSSSTLDLARQREHGRRDHHSSDQSIATAVAAVDQQSQDECGPPPARRRQIRNSTYEEIMSRTSATNTTVYIGGVPSTITEEELKRIFGKYGTIIHTRVFDQQRYAFVKYDQKESAAQAILHERNTEIDGSPIRCSWGKEGNNNDASVSTMNQAGYNFGYPFAAADPTAANNLLLYRNLWNQCYQYYANPSLFQTYWQQQQQQQLPKLDAAGAGILLWNTQ